MMAPKRLTASRETTRVFRTHSLEHEGNFFFSFFLLNAFQSHGWLRGIRAGIDGTISFSSKVFFVFFLKDNWGEDGIPIVFWHENVHRSKLGSVVSKRCLYIQQWFHSAA